MAALRAWIVLTLLMLAVPSQATADSGAGTTDFGSQWNVPPPAPGDRVGYVGHIGTLDRVAPLTLEVEEPRWIWHDGSWVQAHRLADEDGKAWWVHDGETVYWESRSNEGAESTYRKVEPSSGGTSGTAGVTRKVIGLVTAGHGGPLDASMVAAWFGREIEGQAVDFTVEQDGLLLVAKLTISYGENDWVGTAHVVPGEPYPLVLRSSYGTSGAWYFVRTHFERGGGEVEAPPRPPTLAPAVMGDHPPLDGVLGERLAEAVDRAKGTPAYRLWADGPARLVGFEAGTERARAHQDVAYDQVDLVFATGTSVLGIRWTIIDGAWTHEWVQQEGTVEHEKERFLPLSAAWQIWSASTPGVEDVSWNVARWGWWMSGGEPLGVVQQGSTEELMVGHKVRSGTGVHVTPQGGSLGHPTQQVMSVVSLDARSGELQRLRESNWSREIVVIKPGSAATEAAQHGEPLDVSSHSVPGFEPALLTAGGVLGIVALLALLRAGYGVALYAKLRPDRLLQHPTRAGIMAAVRAEPGLCMKDLRARMELSEATARHHVQALKRADLLHVHVRNGSMHLFPVGEVSAREYAGIADARTGRRAEILQLLSERPGVRVADLADRLGISGVATRKHLTRLEASGLVTGCRSSGGKRYYVAKPG